ncbi:hypothetical protein EDC94DRAFT_651273 [Helicostylum pulchrum]|nr:hypothetical protein EDC94DRAFT_651273 [Helicostylum pulchrum]
MSGATKYLFDAIHNSDMYCKPRILLTEPSLVSSSIFLKSKPDAIMSIVILLESTVLSFSLLDENGLAKKTWNHDYFLPDLLRLRPLGSFFKLSEVTTLSVKNWFTAFVDEYFVNDPPFFFNSEYEEFHKDMMNEIEDILNVEKPNKDLLASVQQRVYIKEFVLIYWIYINEIISRKLSTITSSNSNIKIGYAVNIDSILLKRLFSTEDDLRDIIYASNLVQKDDNSKKTQNCHTGRRALPSQLYEGYVQLTLNQVVTESGLDNEEDPEAIIIQEEIIPTVNIYKSLCFNMWNKIAEDSSLIQLCNTHKVYNDNDLLGIFTLENRATFMNNFKDYISKNILCENLNAQKAGTTTLNVSTLCNCSICLTVGDIIEISFRPVLQDIISLVFTSLINEQLFGKYKNIQYLFHLIRFNYNSQLQPILMKILNDETDYFFEDYGAGIQITNSAINCTFKNKAPDSKVTLMDEERVFPFLKMGDKISTCQENRVFYLNSKDTINDDYFDIIYFRLKKTDILKFNKSVYVKDASESISGPAGEINIKQGCDIFFIISIIYKGYTSSISLGLKRSGEGQHMHVTTLAEPMTLTRF